jgi:hypothetical protein
MQRTQNATMSSLSPCDVTTLWVWQAVKTAILWSVFAVSYSFAHMAVQQQDAGCMSSKGCLCCHLGMAEHESCGLAVLSFCLWGWSTAVLKVTQNHVACKAAEQVGVFSGCDYTKNQSMQQLLCCSSEEDVTLVVSLSEYILRGDSVGTSCTYVDSRF